MAVTHATFQAELAAYATALAYDELPPEVVEWAKGVLLDSLGCAVAGSMSDAGQISASVFSKLGGTPESTVIRTGERTACTSAAFVNGVAVRYEDMNDTYTHARKTGHFSDAIASVLAVGEREGSSGEEIIAAIVVAYEALAATTYHGPVIGRGVQPYGAAAIPAVAGRLLGLDAEQVENAIGISLSSNVTLMAWIGTGHGEMPMIKASAFASTASHGILAALMAGEGYTGPRNAIERYIDQFGVDPGECTSPQRGEYTVLTYNMIKAYAAQMHTNAAIEGVVRLRRDHELDPADVEEIVVAGPADFVRYSAGPHTYHPTTRESADHSAPYVVALAMLEGDVLPPQYERRQWEDERAIDLIQRVRCVVDEERDRQAREDGSLPADVEIRMKSGATYAIAIDNPRGHPKNPMTTAEIQDKFRRVVAPDLDPDRQAELIELVANLERAESLAPLMSALAF